MAAPRTQRNAASQGRFNISSMHVGCGGVLAEHPWLSLVLSLSWGLGSSYALRAILASSVAKSPSHSESTQRCLSQLRSQEHLSPGILARVLTCAAKKQIACPAPTQGGSAPWSSPQKASDSRNTRGLSCRYALATSRHLLAWKAVASLPQTVITS